VFTLVRNVAAGLCVFLLLACALQAVEIHNGLQIEGLVIENQTRMRISAVRLLVPATGNFVSCGNIGPGDKCWTTFPEASYTGNPVEITWSQAGQIYSTGEFAVQTPDDVDIDRPALVSVVIAAPGSAGAVIVQQAAQ